MQEWGISLLQITTAWKKARVIRQGMNDRRSSPATSVPCGHAAAACPRGGASAQTSSPGPATSPALLGIAVPSIA